MRYIDEIGTIEQTDADNALIVGQALHTGIEKGVETAIEEYFMSFPVIDDSHINEAIKLEYIIPKAKAVLPNGGEYEVEIQDEEFQGFIDYLTPSKVFERGVELPNNFDIYDFKYSNNISHYTDSNQLHLYKYYWEKCNPGKFIRNMFFLFVPKVNIKQKKTETLADFRKRLLEEISGKEVKVVKIEYQPTKVIKWLELTHHILQTKDFDKNPGYLCRYCEFENYCVKGDYYMLLPKNERRNIEKVEKRVLWIYGVPFCGKTTFANNFPDPLMLNTDGNIKFVDAPYIHIKDLVKVEGRMTKRTQAWEVFKDVVAELEKKDNTFKTIVVDLLEDLYEHCRVYMCGQMGITHESDDSFKAWDKVRSEFLNTLKRLVNCPYENIIFISHEDTTKDITKKGGDKVTAIKPNLADKVANKVAGMVDVVARIVADENIRTFCFKNNEVIFGGGRLKVEAKDIPLDVNALFAVYDEANRNAVRKATTKDKATSQVDTKDETPVTTEGGQEGTKTFDTAAQEVVQPVVEAPSEQGQPVRKTRSRRKDAIDEAVEADLKQTLDDEPPFDTDEGTVIVGTAPMGEWTPQEVKTDAPAETPSEPVRRTRKSRATN